MPTIQAAHLQKVYGIRAPLAAKWAPLIDRALTLSECTNVKRQAAWLAQIGHESGCLRYTREIWGPTTQQARYEPVTTLSGRLGNSQPGDGALYMGRGLIQITGRANYQMCTQRLKTLLNTDVPDFEQEPTLLERPDWAALTAAVFWKQKNLNRFADSGDFAELTRRINGGHNGLAHRQHLYLQAMGALQ